MELWLNQKQEIRCFDAYKFMNDFEDGAFSLVCIIFISCNGDDTLFGVIFFRQLDVHFVILS